MFSFSLWQVVADESPIGAVDPYTEGEAKQEHKPAHRVFKATGTRILIVDDTAMNLEVLKGLLKRSEMIVDTAGGGEECIRKFGENDYDLVLLDYRMPGMDGIETLEALKKRYPEKTADIPIISLTASALAGDREHMLSSGFTDYLTKPVIIEELEDMLHKYLIGDEGALDETEAEEAISSEKEELEQLPAALTEIASLNVNEGLGYCGDADNYLMALGIYHRSYAEKRQQIEDSLESDNLGNYTIAVHALKSSSRAIGCEEVFHAARALEIAGKNGDYETIKKDTPKLLESYRMLVEAIGSALEA